MSINNIAGGKVEAYKLELETTIGMKLDMIKDDHMQNISSLEMKIYSIT